MTDRYTLRHPINRKHINIVHTGCIPTARALVRVPVRVGLQHQAESIAALVCRLLNDHARVIHQEEP